jgi:hypothetical protein
MSERSETGSVVGFVQGDDFTVEFSNKTTSPKTVYFDQRGHRSQHGVSGGGFVSFNIDRSLPNLFIISERTQKVISRIIWVNEHSIQVLNASFE